MLDFIQFRCVVLFYVLFLKAAFCVDASPVSYSALKLDNVYFICNFFLGTSLHIVLISTLPGIKFAVPFVICQYSCARDTLLPIRSSFGIEKAFQHFKGRFYYKHNFKFILNQLMLIKWVFAFCIVYPCCISRCCLRVFIICYGRTACFNFIIVSLHIFPYMTTVRMTVLCMNKLGLA